MASWFECWNGGAVRWDPPGLPRFVFALPADDAGMVRFFQLSGRICEVLTGSEWTLQIGGARFDIPNLLGAEIHHLVGQVRSELGYVAVPVPYQLVDPWGGLLTIPLILWANAQTGRADIFSPATGMVQGQVLLPPEPARPDSGLAWSSAAAGLPAQASGPDLLQSLAGLAGESSGVYDFLSPDVDAGAGVAYSATDAFEEDSAGWPGGAYENPDSAWYTPDYGDGD